MSDEVKGIQELRHCVNELRPVLAERQGAEGYLALFDEFVRECELGLALHNVCDYLLEVGTPASSAVTIEKIGKLHEVMEIDDDCLERLMAKAVSGQDQSITIG